MPPRSNGPLGLARAKEGFARTGADRIPCQTFVTATMERPGEQPCSLRRFTAAGGCEGERPAKPGEREISGGSPRNAGCLAAAGPYPGAQAANEGKVFRGWCPGFRQQPQGVAA